MSKRVNRKAVAASRPKAALVSFGFRHLRQVSYGGCSSAGFFIQYLERLSKLCSLDWNTLYTTHRHSFGTENIPVSRLRHSLRLEMDLESLIALRATGDNHSFLGFRNGDVFEVVFIEANFGDVYDHGSK